MVGIDKMASFSSDNNKSEEVRNQLFSFMTEKSKIETEIGHLFEVLSLNNIGMHESLVDSDGFPRNDIDVYQVRNARHKIICLQNDHKSLMSLIESGLHQLHSGMSNGSSTGAQVQDQSLQEPFAYITLVSPGSPADICGLQTNDLLLEFGSVNKNNFKSMNDVATVVRHSAGQIVPVLLRRKGRHSPLSLDLRPQQWSGQGLIGCKIDPVPTDPVER